MIGSTIISVFALNSIITTWSSRLQELRSIHLVWGVVMLLRGYNHVHCCAYKYPLQVEMMLEDKEKQLYEKTLMLGEINRLVKEAYTASDSTKSETLAEAKKVSSAVFCVRETHRTLSLVR